ncbi:MAG: penicillin-binding protein 2 [Verrucomicrobiota bacterium JB023]|nr:penicillin-binding protein 2 [Verrucomicrobiota bacterium JB023]
MKRGLEVRLLIVCLTLVVGLSALSVRLVFLQGTETGRTSHKESRGFEAKRPLFAQRGYICDRNEEIIARNIPVTTVKVDLRQLGKCNEVIGGVAYPLAMMDPRWATAGPKERNRILAAKRRELFESEDPDDVVRQHLDFLVKILVPRLGFESREALLKKIGPLGHGETIIAKNVTEDVADELEQVIRENRLQGVILQKGYRRWYPNPDMACHVVGIVNHEGVGKSGVERSMSAYLAGKDGYEVTRRDAQDLALGKSQSVVKPPIQGLSVQLTLDLSLQAIVEEELDAGLEFANAERGTIVVMEPGTGEILAMASRPAFNLNLRENVSTAGVNYATQAIYEPGSTIKIVPTSAVMDLGLANRETSVFCHNGHYAELKINDVGHYGWMSLEKVLMKSSNIGTYQFAKMMPKETLYDYYERFGFGQPTGISLGAELSGLLNRSSNPTDHSRISYGYGIDVTPLQLTAAYGAIANGGRLMKPTVVKSAIANNGTKICEFKPEMVRQVVQPWVAREMREALSQVTEEGGTATRARVPGFRVAGKTGTSRKAKPGGYYSNRYVTSFAGMMPAEDPAFVAVVVIDDPRPSGDLKPGGGTIAAPVFAKVASRFVSAMNLVPTVPIPQPEIASQ